MQSGTLLASAFDPSLVQVREESVFQPSFFVVLGTAGRAPPQLASAARETELSRERDPKREFGEGSPAEMLERT
eukprot:15448984-Alexandrium_andersonii.AAC.1